MNSVPERPPSRWQKYVEAAVRPPVHGTLPDFGHAIPPGSGPRLGGAAAVLPGPHPIRTVSSLRSQPGYRGRIREQLQLRLFPEAKATKDSDQPRRRTDLRLAPPALLVWSAAVAGIWLPPAGLVALCCGLLLAAACLLAVALRRRGNVGTAPRSFLTTLAVAFLLAVATAAHAAVASSQRNDGPVAAAIASGSSVVAELEITGAPRELKMPGQSGFAARWAVPARVTSMIAGGQVLHAEAGLVVMGGTDWKSAVTGQRIRTTGRLKAPDDGQPEAGILAASSAPVVLAESLPWQAGPGELRGQYVSATGWLGGDARGLLPGMVTGDTNALDEQLNASMKTVGMTHLTAVSGANCSLILGALLLAARTLRLARVPAAGFALAGLGLFVLMVGPDASVLRAALMGSIALASLAGGRTGRGLSFLCLAVIGLLLLDPGLGTSFGFLLSVLATLGIIVLGKRIVDWIPAAVPRWVAAGIAVPLSAQLLCGPVIVILQPQFSTYALLANVVAAPLVAPVTVLGTAAVPLVPLIPWLAAALIAVAGVFTSGVAAVARFMAGLPGAALPWPEGVFGLVTMVLFSGVTMLALWLAVQPFKAARLFMAAHARIAAMPDGISARGLRRTNGRRLLAGGLVQPLRRGTLRVCNPNSGRNQEWLLPRPNEAGPRRRTRHPGGM